MSHIERLPTKILLIDDSALILEIIGDALEEWGYVVTKASSGGDGISAFEREHFDIVITDMMMPDMDGTSVLLELRDRVPDVIVIMLSSYSQIETVLNAMRLGAFDYVIKDERLDTLQGAVQRAQMHLRLLFENRDLMVELQHMNERLEQRVRNRTRQLESANRRLTIERGELERALRALNETQGQLIHAEKMASMGVLTAGVAHEINNPLAFLLPNFQCLEEQCRVLSVGGGENPDQTSREIDDLLKDCREGLYRIRDIVKELGFFSRRSDALERRVELEPLVSSVFKLLSNQMVNVSLRIRLEEVPDICADPGQLRQVLLNLLINAGHAIPESQRGVVEVSANAVGSAVRIHVRDNGVGIPLAVQSKIFDPFFTTKPVGQGTGMGLAISRQLVERMKGALRVESEPGSGTTMIIELPAWDDALAPIVEEAEETQKRAIAGATRRALILVVDDEQALLNSMRRVLSQRYEVVGHRWATQALEWLNTSDRPDAVLCDLMMPEMSGIEFYREVAKRNSDLAQRFVFITGGTVTQEARDFVATCELPVIRKPFELDDMVDTIESILSPINVLAIA